MNPAPLRLAAAFAVALALPGCRDKPDDSARKPKAGSLEATEADRRAVVAFAVGLREAIAWRQDRPAAPDPVTRAAFLDQLAAIPADGLPDDLAGPWRQLLDAMRAAGDGSQPPPDSLRAAANEAAAALNRALTTRGYPDLRF